MQIVHWDLESAITTYRVEVFLAKVSGREKAVFNVVSDFYNSFSQCTFEAFTYLMLKRNLAEFVGAPDSMYGSLKVHGEIVYSMVLNVSLNMNVEVVDMAKRPLQNKNSKQKTHRKQ